MDNEVVIKNFVGFFVHATSYIEYIEEQRTL